MEIKYTEQPLQAIAGIPAGTCVRDTDAALYIVAVNTVGEKGVVNLSTGQLTWVDPTSLYEQVDSAYLKVGE